MVGVLLVDLSAAFDMVDHSILLKKLELYGMDHQSISWMNSHLSRRSQVVMVDGCLSPSLNITCGVPQGSILGPLLYIIFTNEIPDLVHNHYLTVQSVAALCAMWMTPHTVMEKKNQQFCRKNLLSSTKGSQPLWLLINWS